MLGNRARGVVTDKIVRRPRQRELTRADPEIVDGLGEADEVRIGQRVHRQCALETGKRR